jgi:DNA-binding transcriptional ArsR family regulator
MLYAGASDTAQQVLATLEEELATTSDIAEAIDTSIQNATYHLDHLCDVGLIEAVDTWYSRKGTEMTVYVLSVETLVIQFGDPNPAAQR